MDVIREYAKRKGLEIVKEYSDEGKSGLNIEGRDSLAQMIQDVQGGQAGFSNILVYDVSRWGRFQDADESAYYEYICRKAGVAVHYCAEQFENDGSPVPAIVVVPVSWMRVQYHYPIPKDEVWLFPMKSYRLHHSVQKPIEYEDDAAPGLEKRERRDQSDVGTDDPLR